MAKKKSSAKSKAVLSFEQSLSELERVVSSLEQGELSLDESLEKYQAGMKYLRTCYSALQKAEKQIHVLVDVDDAGNAKVANFEHDATHSDSDEDDENDFSDEDPNEGSLF